MARVSRQLGFALGVGAGAVVLLGAEGLAADVLFTEHVVTTTATWAADVHGADVDGDGFVDILSASMGDNTIAWYRSDGGSPPMFSEQIISTSEPWVGALFYVDVNGDGHKDVVTGARAGDRVAWWEHTPAMPPALPTFTAQVIGTTDYPIWVYAADVDGDLDVDVLSAAVAGDEFVWWENRGGASPTFVKHALASPLDENANCIMTGFIDGDSDLDFVTAAYGSDTISWWESDGGTPPLFTEHVITTLADVAQSAYPADFDADGDVDILACSIGDDTIALWLNDGLTPPGFTRQVVSATGDGARWAHGVDLDGDDDLDAVASWYRGDTVAWYENLGGDPLVFAEHVISTNCDGPYYLFSADLDGDSDIDVIVPSVNDNTVRWFENLGPPNEPPSCPAAVVVELWPPNHKFESIVLDEVVSVTDPDDDPVLLTVTSITQDEPINAPDGDGNTSCDGSGIGTNVAEVMRERQGTGNGRVYHVEYIADDGNGGTCEGAVLVHVRHSQNGDPAIDDGQSFDSTACSGVLDLNADGQIDGDDLIVVIETFGMWGPDENLNWPDGDANQDGGVDEADYDLVASALD